MRGIQMITLVLSLTVVGCTSTNDEIDFVGQWSVSDLTPTGVIGVSPELIEFDEKISMLVTTIEEKKFWQLESGEFSNKPITLPHGADYTAIKKDDGSWIIYFLDFLREPGPEPPSPDEPKGVFSVTTEDFSSFSEPVHTGISQASGGQAWGVPDSVRTPDGDYYIYWVDEVDGEPFEVIRVATSEDGVLFDALDEPVIVGGYVDPFVLQASEGDWLMLLSTTPHPPKLPQKLHLAKSVDGLTWVVDSNPLLVDAEWNYLDPTAIKLGDEWFFAVSRVALEEAQNPMNAEVFSGRLKFEGQD